MQRRIRGLALCLSALAGPAGAHPHIFIDTAFDLVFDDAGRLAAIRIEWAYDEFYSLLLIEDEGLDADRDGVPEPARLADFAGNDVDWEAGFPGDFTVTFDAAPADLGAPRAHAAEWRDGRLVTSHERPLETPRAVEGQGVVARAYDPTYFVAYAVPDAPGIVGRDDCRLTRDVADHDAAIAELGETLLTLDETDDPFDVVERDDIGILFADGFRLSCDTSS